MTPPQIRSNQTLREELSVASTLLKCARIAGDERLTSARQDDVIAAYRALVARRMIRDRNRRTA